MPAKLKDRFFQDPFFRSLASEIEEVCPRFDTVRFFRLLYDEQWPERELKQRLRHVSEVLGQTLPADYREAIEVLKIIEGRFDGFEHLLFADFVERFGVDDYEASIPALELFTRSSAEFAIRPFIRRYPDRTMAQMLAWARSDDKNVRRLATEGCRPRLPWGAALADFKNDPTPILPILHNLKDDPSEYVRRSVANNLNDISKDHPDLALGVAEGWLTETPTSRKLVKHALRGLLKQGHPRALELFGLGNATGLAVSGLQVDPVRIPIGGAAAFRFELTVAGEKSRNVRLEYVIDYVKARGQTSPKVFHIRELEATSPSTHNIKRKLSFLDRTTRKHYPGQHHITVVVNGRRRAAVPFLLFQP